MEILWEQGESSVHDVIEKVGRPLAYTTVMTTLDRLYKKGLLNRHKSDRAFLYRTRHTRLEWEQKRAGEFVAGYLNGPQAAGAASCYTCANLNRCCLAPTVSGRNPHSRSRECGSGRNRS